MKPAQVKSEIVGAVAILLFRGGLTVGVGDAPLEAAVARELDAGHRYLLLDLSEASTVDSTGIGALITGHTHALQRQGRLDLCAVPPKIRAVLSVSQTDSLFRIFGTKEEGLRAALADAAASAGALPPGTAVPGAAPR